ncbi:hypothetical protein PINS_up002519 [Pythium insidiosum]|nr:hypothetical protein PINS_up002519 [Pythium insidiosum]
MAREIVLHGPKATLKTALDSSVRFAALAEAARVVVGCSADDEEKQYTLKYVDVDGDEVTIGTDADLKEVLDYMEDEGLEKLDVQVKPAFGVRLGNHVRGIVHAISKLSKQVQVQPTNAPTIGVVLDALREHISQWELPEDAETMIALKEDALVILNDEKLGALMVSVPRSEQFRDVCAEIVAAFYGEKALEDVVTSHWTDVLALIEFVLAQCPHLKETFVRLADGCVKNLVEYAKQLVASETMPVLVEVQDEEPKESDVVTEPSDEDEQYAALVHKNYRCDGCRVLPIVGPRFRSTSSAEFDLCSSCKRSGAYDAEHGPFNKIVRFMPIHFGIVCDGCEMSPIAGVRFKSFVTNDFDLCETCEAIGDWASHEPFIKINEPSKAPRMLIVDRPRFHPRARATPPPPPTPPTVPRRPSPEPVVHTFVVCDGCEMSPLVGTRFKSASANNFDLCERCHASGAWEQTHGPFQVVGQRSSAGAWVPFSCRRPGPQDHGSQSHHHPGPHHHHHHGHRHPDRHHHGRHHHHHDHHHPSHHHHHHHHGHHGHRHPHHGSHHDGHSHHRDRHHHPRQEVDLSAPILDLIFVEDVTVPDGTMVAPETEIVKSWKVKNSGAVAWPEGCVLEMQSGRFGVSPFEGDPSRINVAVPPLFPGLEYVIETQFTTPVECGRYRAFWRMVDPTGTRFGHRLWIDIFVSEEIVIDEEAAVNAAVSRALDAASVDAGLAVEQPTEEDVAAQPVDDPKEVEVVEPSVTAAESIDLTEMPSEVAADSDDGVVVEREDSDSEDSFSVRSEVSDDSASDSHASEDTSDGTESEASIDDTSASESEDEDECDIEDADCASETSAGSTISANDEAVDAKVNEGEAEHNVEADVVEELYMEALVILESMGFGDKESNRRVLAEWGGNIADAIESLLKEE